METDKEKAARVRAAVDELKAAVADAQEADITVKLGVVYGKVMPKEGETPDERQKVRDITCSLTKDL